MTKANSHRVVVVVLPYVNTYRDPFLRALKEILSTEDIELMVFTGEQAGQERGVADVVNSADYRRLTQIAIRIGDRRIQLRVPRRQILKADLVILEQATRNLESYLILVARKIIRRPTAGWGHGYTITEPQSRLARVAQAWMMRRADYFFAYTPGSLRRGVSVGASLDRSTVVYNSIDTSALRAARNDALQRTSREAGPPAHSWTALYVGALHASKRIDVLLRIASAVHARDSRFRLVIAGSGGEPELLRSFESMPWVHFVGHADTALKATLAVQAEVLLVPGRVGLVAVDSFALELPIITLNWEYHAPEFEYLNPGNSIVAADENTAVESVLRLMGDPDELAALKAGARDSLAGLSIDQMAINFASGVSAAIDKGPK
jgi:glycosyltransferase involved in cell wall biosynthesis